MTHDGVLSQTGCPTADVVGDPVVRKACRYADLNDIAKFRTSQIIVNVSVTVSLDTLNHLGRYVAEPLCVYSQ